MIREHIKTLPNGLKLYRVKLVGGPADGTESICSHDTVIHNDEHGSHRYIRGADDSYHYQGLDLGADRWREVEEAKDEFREQKEEREQ